MLGWQACFQQGYFFSFFRQMNESMTSKTHAKQNGSMLCSETVFSSNETHRMCNHFSPWNCRSCRKQQGILKTESLFNLIFFFFFFFFFFAFPSYISGVHHFGVRFLRMWPFFNPTIKVVTFRLRGWCVLGVFLLPAFTRLGHERQDLLSPCDEMHVCTD